MPYDEKLEPIANENEAAEYAEEAGQEEEEEQMLLSRFSREDDIREWYVALCAGIFRILSFCAPIICLYFDILILKRLDIRLETDHAQLISKGFSRRFFIQSAEKLTVS